jgi:hypothetical protein
MEEMPWQWKYMKLLMIFLHGSASLEFSIVNYVWQECSYKRMLMLIKDISLALMLLLRGCFREPIEVSM